MSFIFAPHTKWEFCRMAAGLLRQQLKRLRRLALTRRPPRACAALPPRGRRRGYAPKHTKNPRENHGGRLWACCPSKLVLVSRQGRIKTTVIPCSVCMSLLRLYTLPRSLSTLFVDFLTEILSHQGRKSNRRAETVPDIQCAFPLCPFHYKPLVKGFASAFRALDFGLAFGAKKGES